MQRVSVELWLTVDSEGQYEVAFDRDEACEKHADNNGIAGSLAIHRLALSVPLPQDISATITLPDDATGEPVVIEE
jgi:hypothetical protein